MPLRDDLLNPVSESSPGGENLRYAPVYDKIKEARREDDDAPQGEWQRARKVADWPLVIKLAGEAIATKSKDLQLAVWLTEALLKKDGFAGLREGLTLIQGLIERFWDTCYPELEDGDAELRGVPLDWLGGRLDSTLRSTPISKKGLSWYKYKESRSIGYEADADTYEKQESRAANIADGKVTAEDWDSAFNATSKDWYAGLEADIDAILELLENLSAIAEEKFGDAAPSFGPMRNSLEEIRNTVHTLLNKKRESEPDVAATAVEEAPVEEESSGWDETPSEPVVAAARPKPRRGGPLAPEPVDREDACQRIVGVAEFLRREDPYNPAPFLLLRALRWGELRAAGYLDPNLLDAPPTEIRQALKRLSTDGEWQQLLDTAESAMGLPCGRGWLDIQRHAYRACYELSYSAAAAAIQSALKSILADLPDLLTATLLDDTPAANAETQAWIAEINPPPEAPAPSYSYTPAPPMDEPAYSEGPADKPEDPGDIAMRAAREGRPQEAIEILTREAAAERSGRGRFQRRLQLAQLCTSMGHERIAHPILEQLVSEIDNRSLEGWESPDTVAHVLALLYRCLDKLNTGEERKQLIYDRICRLDPIQALSCTS